MKLRPEAGSAIDAARWIAATVVVIYHSRSTIFESYGQLPQRSVFDTLFYAVTTPGHQAVIVFFVLSGFLVGGSALSAHREGRFDGKTYAINRFSRLYAVLPVALLLGVGLDLLRLRIFGLIPEADPGGAWSHHNLSPGIFLANLFNLQRVVAPELGSNTALWSLTNEFWYYVLFPLLLKAADPKAHAMVRGICTISAFAILWFVGLGISAYFLIWLMGAAAFQFHHRVRLPIWIPLLVAAGAVVAGIGVSRYFSAVGSTDAAVWQLQFPTDLALGLGCGGVLACLLNCEWRPGSIWGRAAGFNQRLAGFSYTLYLVHWPLLAFVYSGLRHANLIGRLRPDLTGLAALAALVAFIMMFAYAISLLTERHTPQFRAFLLSRLP